MIPDLVDNWPAATAGIAAALAGAVLYGKRVLTSFAREDANTVRAEAEVDIITSLRSELDRLGQQNVMLAEQLIKLQATAIDLQDAVRITRRENGELRDEIQSLRGEISRLSRPGGPVAPAAEPQER